ncbi:MAG: hypothetical protein CSA73_00560 [Rhodobacterales bacterium]|nr:MAG: hypothetical protein CSA73_00560 [Rhodobacterales bacterium]
MSKIINDKGEVEYVTASQIVDRILRDEVKIAARQFDEIGLRARLMGTVSPPALGAPGGGWRGFLRGQPDQQPRPAPCARGL